MAAGPRLTPLADVEPFAGGWRATGPEPWLRCEIVPRAGWVRLQYASGLCDPLFRPKLRFVGGGGRDEILPAAALGRASWIGEIPEAREIHISPTLGEGPFAFRIERWEWLTPLGALARFPWREAGRAARYVYGRCRGLDAFARAQARRALGPTPLTEYGAWRRARERSFEAGFDDLGAAIQAPRIHVVPVGASLDVAEEDYVVALSAGDLLDPLALRRLAAATPCGDRPDAIYADEDEIGADGDRRAPRLKPDWSPIFAAGGYMGAPVALRGDAWKAGGFDPETARVAHVRRIAVSRRAPPPAPAPRADEPLGARRQATVVLPTRDRLDLLRPCVESLARHDPGADVELIVLDNDTRDADALAYLDEIAARTDVRVLRRPGPFNYAALCNEGAGLARRPFLLFLNNDVRALGAGWLGRMLALATRPRVGAVGAKLLFPDGRLQHGGVVLGLDGFAGHLQRAAGAEDAGYLGALAWPREVSAVTGACLAVEARKFHEVGGFDAARLPIEYNDIDLCLRLAERGYGAVFEPRAVLEHHESASRGNNPRLDMRYAGEHAHFGARWARRLRDDPFFHPALSLDALDVALG